ncbi:PP2C family protein-serine/threonine phosphatase [Nocardia thailandica]
MTGAVPPRDGASSAATVAGRPEWTRAAHPAVLVGPDSVVLARNEAAAAMFPQVSDGVTLAAGPLSWLQGPHRALSSTPLTPRSALTAGRLGDHVIDAHPTVLGDGSVLWWLLTDTATALERAERDLREAQERTAFLAEAAEILMGSLNPQRCMESIARIAADRLGDAAVVVAAARRRYHPITQCDSSGEVRHCVVEHDPARVPGLIEALRGFPPMPARWIDPAAVPTWLLPDSWRGPLGAVAVIGLPGHGVPAGALILLHRGEHHLGEAEELVARLFAARAGIALSAAQMYAEQTSITGILLRELLPPQLHRIQGVELAGGYRAAENHEVIGGDFYDVYPAEQAGQESLVVLGDVCGKGLEAAILTGKIRNTLQALVPTGSDHQTMLRLLNKALLASQHDRFATLVLASIVHSPDRIRLRLTSGGHLPPLVVRADGTVEVTPTQGQLVGALPEISARTVEVVLGPGETCLLYTDGITEARGGALGNAMFGEQRLAQALAACAGMPADAVVEHLRMLVEQWVGANQRDDIALVAITVPTRYGRAR